MGWQFLKVWMEILKNCKKIVRLLIKISSENWVFPIFAKYFLNFFLFSESIYHWKIRPIFSNNFSDFGGGAFRGSPSRRHRFRKINRAKTYQISLVGMLPEWKAFGENLSRLALCREDQKFGVRSSLFPLIN